MDYLKQHRELRRLLEESAGIKHLRSLETSFRHIIEPMRTPYIDALHETIAEMQRHRERDEKMLRSITGGSSFVGLEDAMRGVVPTSFQSLLDATIARNDLFARYTHDAFSAKHSAFSTLESVRKNILGETFSGADWLRPRILGDLGAITDVASVLRGSPAATLATALDGWRAMADQSAFLAVTSVNPLAESARFLRQSAETFARQDDPLVTRAVETAVALTDIELRSTMDLLDNVEVDDEPEIVPERRLLVPRRQRFDVQRHAEALDGLELEEILGMLPVGQIVLVAREVVGVVGEINEARAVAGATPIFKLTHRVSRVIAELPFTLAINERTFADVVDDLYWLLYESPGSRTLRFLKENGGPVEDAECEVIFFIKRLRNYFRHDPEHGGTRDIEKKLEALREDLSKRGFTNGLPRTRREYERLHRLLLEEAAAFLRTLHARV